MVSQNVETGSNVTSVTPGWTLYVQESHLNLTACMMQINCAHVAKLRVLALLIRHMPPRRTVDEETDCYNTL